MESKVPGGYSGKVLRVDLGSERVTTEQMDASFCRKYLGGAGFIAYYLLTEFKPSLDPLGPENKLIFALGPLTGIPLGGCARHMRKSGISRSETSAMAGSRVRRGFRLRR